MPSVLGLDLGEKRVGVAVADEMLAVATPVRFIEFRGREQLMAEVLVLIREYKIIRIVVGLPKTLKGETGIAARKIKDHVAWFQQRLPEVEWLLWDERLTTGEVERVLLEADVSRDKRKRVRDQLAAQRILQSYLDCRRTGK